MPNDPLELLGQLKNALESITPLEEEGMGKKKECKICKILKKLEGRIGALAEELEGLKSQSPTKSLDATQLETLETENATLTKEKAELKDKIKGLESAKQEIEGQKNGLQKALEDKKEELKKVQAALEHSEQQAQQDKEALQGKLDRQRIDNDRLEQKLKGIEDDLKRAQEDEAELKNKSENLEQELRHAKTDRERLEGELNTARADCQNLKDAHAKLEDALKAAKAYEKEAMGYKNLVLVQLLNLAKQSDRLLERLGIDKNATLDDLFASKLGQDRLFVLKCIAEDIQHFREDLAKIQPLIAFFNALFPLLESTEKLTRLSVREEDSYNPREHATPKDPQPVRGKVKKVHFVGYKQGSAIFKSLVEV
ncbi:hypothetical protein NHP21005_14160 [Helicobacter sp. NHP21005]|uniref:hypothetical protein n=1 Tax=Helicobacter felistomachi TaxID=3040201 RepID=UPI0025746AF6|nr:hypothetical protein [Helicobacter sp. NHP21005]BEG57728.1 hypothetical protein NHP21005_14160 [Helicobacter sp. NHP21005]